MISMRYHAEIIMNTYDEDFIQFFLKEKAITGEIVFFEIQSDFQMKSKSLVSFV